VGSFLRFLLGNPLIKPIIRPITRILLGLIAIPLFRLFLKKVIRLQEMDEELEKDLEQWFRGSLVLLASMVNMENALFSWFYERVEFVDLHDEQAWIMAGLRLLMAIAAIESMPDQELFAIIHPGPPKLELSRKKGIFKELLQKKGAIFKGILCQHINRSSPVFAILACIAPGRVGWICYCLALVQYLIIGLVTSKDKALEVLTEFDRQVSMRRREIIDEFQLKEKPPQKDGGESAPPSDLPETNPPEKQEPVASNRENPEIVSE